MSGATACSSAVGIICKAPRAGRGKTRLIPVVGPDDATALSVCFMQDLSATIDGLATQFHARGYAVFAPADGEAEIRALMPASFGFLFQGHADLGNVLYLATDALLSRGHDFVLLVNSDSPTLPGAYLERAIERLMEDGDRVVFGPAIDGGYYLIGLKTAHRRLFEDIAWSTSAVLEQSCERARELGLEVSLLPSWYDVDDAESLAMLCAEMAGRPPMPGVPMIGATAPATRRLVASRAGAWGYAGFSFAD